MDTYDTPSTRRYYGSPYGYWPSFGWNIAGITGFTLSTLWHLGQAIYYIVRRRKLERLIATKESGADGVGAQQLALVQQPRYWFIFATLFLGGTLETVGWWIRWASTLELEDDAGPFLGQLITLILAPCFIAAFNYTLFGLGVRHLGEEYSLLKGKWYMILFVIADAIGAVIQVAGGVIAANRFQDRKDTTTATNTIVAGLAIQLAATMIFVALGLDFTFRLVMERPRRIRQHVTLIEGHTAAESSERGTRKRWLVLLATVFFSVAMLVMRAVYRTVDYAKGWPAYREIQYSTPDKQELYFGVFDFLPMILCLLVFNIVHPGMILGSQRLFRVK
ncbi:hypothetical protein QFC20_004957 [Naganishia adeliensis]|uniref:Uncharacterized protein n=1 Tax=Naganishia adeliensis TaxID=92952 RepID=A0ACC2VTD8_9TREE|nr:hypothetical protein QFC20_004957 [Naganishia adeliensis]